MELEVDSSHPFLCGFYPVVHFTEEQIEIRIRPDQVIVDGDYVYQNPFPFAVSQGFTIPFKESLDQAGKYQQKSEIIF